MILPSQIIFFFVFGYDFSFSDFFLFFIDE